MHEMSVALAVVDQVEEAARSGRAAGVTLIRLEVGELAGVVPDSLAFCFELACAGTLLEGAELITTTVPGRAQCVPCENLWDVGMPPRLLCPACGRATTELVSGRELRISEVRWAGPVPARESPREPISEES